MLALFGLLTVAIAGTAFVGALPASEDADSPESTADIGDGIDTQPDDVPDLLSLLDRADADEDQSTAPPVGDGFAGVESDNTFNGSDGGDYLSGEGGNDTLSGGSGDDQMHGGTGDDQIDGEDGDDQEYGDLGNDDMSGGDGNDTLHGGSGNDHIHGGAGDDEILGGYDDDTLIGGEGSDMIQGSEGNDVLDGASGEVIAEVDYLNGSEGDDHLIGNQGDVMSGGEDADTFEIAQGAVSIMDFSTEDVLVLQFEGTEPTLTTEVTDTGLTLLADGEPVADLYGLSSFDIDTVKLVAA